MGVDQQNLPSLVQKSVRRTSPVSHSRTSTLWSRSQSEKPSLSLVQNSVKRTSPLSSRSHSELPLSPIRKLVSRVSTPWSRSQSREPPPLSHQEVGWENLHSLVQKSVRRTSTLSRPKVRQKNLPSLIHMSVRTSPFSSGSQCGDSRLSSPEDSQENPSSL